jgi:predicted amidohydrolase YtcJ
MGEDRAGKTWPLKSLLSSAGHIAIGSDCPVVDNNPFLEIFRAITRVHNDDEPSGGWNPSEKLTLSEILRGYTLDSAWGARRENELGSLEVGKFADIVIMDRDIFSVSHQDIKETKVAMTIFDGEVVYVR